ncbi:PTR2-domain-containing protein [Exidia glandulosa HHB12029]|uniref:PTR2-domain-containing protein n=1 Tax=Exidia glandulosa HHB12029 TaxID=1314781 RepID=A0A165IRZ9_EXIGL|nr:PTR2-domain-containing protein [Exidia glandulosa HHB12029]
MTTVAHANPILDFESAPVDSKVLEKDTALAHTVDVADVDADGREPTEEELATLRKVSAGMPWPAIAMCLIEFAERASYYGSTGPFTNFIRGGLPDGSPGNTGAVAKGTAGLEQKPGALGKGGRTATALTTLFQFLAYTIPIFGGIVADTKWGRFKTICVGTAVGAIAHILLVIPAIPSVILSGNALAPFIISILILAFAAGFIKPSLAPLLCDQSPVHHQTVKTLKSGEKVIVDPSATVQRYLLVFYWSINIGAFFAIATTYAEHDVGFWLAYLLPGIIYCLMPIVLVLAYKRLYLAPPQGSVVLEASRVTKRLFANGGWKRCWKGGPAFWDAAKPSVIEQTEGAIDKKVVFWDDKFVDELKQSFDACKVFLLIPIFNLCDGGLGSTENLMTVAMKVNGVPNDLIGNFNPLVIVIATPLVNLLYTFLDKRRWTYTPMWRMATGFLLASLSMIIGAILQWKIYEESACGRFATGGDEECFTSISLWWQIPLITLPAIGEIFVNVTSYEIAYTRAPARMKGLVYSGVLFTSAISSAITLALDPVLVDPYLIWPYVALAVAGFVTAFAFPIFFKHLDKPVVFNDVDRMEGKQQPTYLAEHGSEAGESLNEKH